jgi:hypothetical protein
MYRAFKGQTLAGNDRLASSVTDMNNMAMLQNKVAEVKS